MLLLSVYGNRMIFSCLLWFIFNSSVHRYKFSIKFRVLQNRIILTVLFKLLKCWIKWKSNRISCWIVFITVMRGLQSTDNLHKNTVPVFAPQKCVRKQNEALPRLCFCSSCCYCKYLWRSWLFLKTILVKWFQITEKRGLQPTWNLNKNTVQILIPQMCFRKHDEALPRFCVFAVHSQKRTIFKELLIFHCLLKKISFLINHNDWLCNVRY